MNDKSTQLTKNTTPGRRLRLFARILAGGMVVFAFISSVFGRIIYNANKQFAWLLPWVGALAVVIVVGGLVVLHRRSNKGPRARIEPAGLKRALMITAALVVFSSTAAEQLIVDPIERIHFFKYGLLSLFCFFSQQHGSVAKRLLKATFIAAFVGISEESLQSVVPNRVSEARDMMLNTVGAIFGAAFSWLTLQWQSIFTHDKNTEAENIPIKEQAD